MAKIKPLPYGAGDFESVQLNGDYYVDKTMYIPLVERIRFNFLIRPRRFGKTLFLSTLQSYYDINKADRFDEFYRDTWILNNPTENRAKYLILYFNFSLIDPAIDKVEESFNTYCRMKIFFFLKNYRQYLDDDVVEQVNNVDQAYQKLSALSAGLAGSERKIYLLIDEYDNFANTIIARHSEKEYHKITREEGFFKLFFNVLKGAASGSGSGLARMFITGVSPITMDDVTSGFNVGNNISLDEEFNELLGFTERDVSEFLDYYASVGVFKLDTKESLEIMAEWYDGYMFSEDAEHTVYNTDMVLYFMKEAYNKSRPVRDLIDENVRIDYGKLRHFLTVNKQLNGNFDILETIVAEGAISSPIVKSFPYRNITRRENFISLLFFFGLISLSGSRKGKPRLHIPNLVIKELMRAFIRKGYEDVQRFNIDIVKLDNLLADMAYDGNALPCVEFVAESIAAQTSTRDLIKGENVVKALFLSLMNVIDFFIVETEKEANHGYTDMVMHPFLAKYTDMNYAYLVEFKYIPRGEFSGKLKTEKIEQARTQLAKYMDDEKLKKRLHAKPHGRITIQGLILVFNGHQMVHYEEIH